jgi:cytochrome oxidase Cu insertion factor (SCO1/SenC/PrrC family)
MKKIIYPAIAPFIIIVLSVAVLWAGYNSLSKPLPKMGQITSFELTNSLDKKVSVQNLNGKVWVANFVFTRCKGPCPLLTKKMAKLQRKFTAKHGLNVVTITVDPEFDTPKVLHSYAQEFQADESTWHFLTGKRKQIEDLMLNQFKLGFAEDIIFHSDRMVLVDKESNIRGFYQGTSVKDYKKLMNDIKKIL